MKITVLAFLLVLGLSLNAQELDQQSVFKELFDLKSELRKLNQDLISVNRKLGASAFKINGDAIVFLSDSIDAINRLRIADSLHFERKIKGLKEYSNNSLRSDATYLAYKKLDSIRILENKLLEL